MDKSLTFYRNILGFSVERRLNFFDENIVFITHGDVRIELIDAPDKENKSTMHVAFHVECISKIIKKFSEHGLFPSEGPYRLNNGWKVIFYRGPDGETLEFVEEKIR